MKRIFQVRVNLDTLCADLDQMQSDAEVADWVRGFRIGSRGASVREDASVPSKMGAKFGQMAHNEATAFSKKQAEKGVASACKRWGKSNQNVTTDKPEDNYGYTTAEPNCNPTNNEQRIENIEKANEPARAPEKSQDIFGGPKPELQPLTASDRWLGEVKNSAWSQALKKAGAKIGPDTWIRWEALIEKHTLPVVLAAAGSVPATIRWPDQTEEVLRKAHGQAPLGASVAQRTVKL